MTMLRRKSEAVEQRGVARQAHAAERSEQLLHAVRDENCAERYAQDRLGILFHRVVNAAERGNVVTRCCFSHYCDPSTSSSHRLRDGDGRKLRVSIAVLCRRSLFLRQHPIDAEAAGPGYE